MTAVKITTSTIENIDDTIADSMYHTLGSHHLAIVDLRAAKRTEKDDEDTDGREVHLAVSQFTLATPGPVHDLLRDLARALYLGRAGKDQLELGNESTDDVVARGQRHLAEADADTPAVDKPKRTTKTATEADA